jgi:hypothetical protein
MPETPISPLSPPMKDGKMWTEPDMGLLAGQLKIFYYGTPNGYVVQLSYDIENRDKKPVLSVSRIDGYLDIRQYDTVVSFPKTSEDNVSSNVEESIFEIDDLAKANEFVDKAKSLPKAKEKLAETDRWVKGLYPPMLFQ